MKSASEAYIAKEEFAYRQPAELYKIWRGSDVWRYTSGDVAVEYDGYTWQPATIERGTVQYNSNLDCSELDVTFAKVDPAVAAYLAGTPLVRAWIEILKLFRDQNPYETLTLFIGEVQEVTLKGPAARARCVGAERVLQQIVPRRVYQPECNWTLFGAQCGLAEASYKLTTTVTVSGDGMTLESADFGAQPDGYWVLGSIEYGSYKRLAVLHSGNYITLNAKIPGLETGMSVDAYPGCDGKLATCRDKFDNLLNFGGHPYIPLDNPCTWIRK